MGSSCNPGDHISSRFSEEMVVSEYLNDHPQDNQKVPPREDLFRSLTGEELMNTLWSEPEPLQNQHPGPIIQNARNRNNWRGPLNSIAEASFSAAEQSNMVSPSGRRESRLVFASGVQAPLQTDSRFMSLTPNMSGTDPRPRSCSVTGRAQCI